MGVRLPARERRAAILRSAMDLFSRDGFEGVTTRALAASSGVSEAMLYKHFPRKQDIYREILARHVEEMEKAMPLAGLAASGEPPVEFFGRIADRMLRRMDADPTLLRLMFFSVLEGHPMAKELERARARGLRDAIADYVRGAVRRGEIRGVDPDMAARSFVWLVLGCGISRVLFREPVARRTPRPVLVRHLVDQFLRGLVPAESGT